MSWLTFSGPTATGFLVVLVAAAFVLAVVCYVIEYGSTASTQRPRR